MHAVLAALLLTAMATTARADTITLRTGKQLVGAIVEETPQQLVVRTRFGTLRLSASEIASVARDGMVPEEIDADAAREAKNLASAAEMYRAALARVGNNAQARERLEGKLHAVEAEMAAANRSAIEKDIGLLRQAVAEKRYDDAIALAERLGEVSMASDQTSTVARLKAEAHFGRATQMLDRMDYVGADRELEKAVAAYEPFYRAHLLLGERLLASAYTQNQGIDEVLKGLRYGEKEISEAERVKYHYLVARALYQRGDYKEAASHFVECVGGKDKFPAYADALDRAADCFVKMGEQTLLKNAQEAVNNLKSAIELDPKRAQAWFLMGKLYRDLGQTENAIDAFRKLIELEPNFPYGHEFLALALIDAKNYDEALQHLNEEIKQRPTNYQAYVDRAEVHIALGNFQEADQDLATVTSKDPSRWEAFMARARLAYVQEEYDKAQENIQQALALKRDAIEAHILMGKVLRAKKDYDGAKQWLLNVVDYLTKVPDLTFKYKTYLAEAQTQLAEIDLEQDSPRQAQTRLEIALEKVPNFAEAHARLGDVKKRLASDVDAATRKSYYREAESCYKKAIEADPKNPDYYLALGILYHKNLKDTAKAVENYERYLELGGKDKATVAKWIEECGGTVSPELLQTSGTAEALTSGSQTEQ